MGLCRKCFQTCGWATTSWPPSCRGIASKMQHSFSVSSPSKRSGACAAAPPTVRALLAPILCAHLHHSHYLCCVYADIVLGNAEPLKTLLKHIRSKFDRDF